MKLPTILFVVVLSIFTQRLNGLEVVLEDTREATTDLKWFTSPEDGWIEMSNDDENQIPFRTYQVCSIQTPGQNNWVRTPYFDVGEAEKVFVEIKFTMRSCVDLPNVATCKETFNLYYFAADSDNSGMSEDLNEQTYTKIDTIAADEQFPIGTHVLNTKTREIGPLSRKGLYIAFQDTGACMALFYVRIYYKKCDDVIQNLARFSSTVTGPERMSLVKVTGECMNNAVWEEGYEAPTLHCNSEGAWDLPTGSCQCRPGYEPSEDMTECRECISGQFKSSVGNSRCMSCPDNSLSIKHAATECICSAGYYRSPEDELSTPCTKPPSQPENVEYVVDKTSVALKWSPPKYNGGRSDVTYSISCLRCDSTYSICSECGDLVAFEPSEHDLLAPQVAVYNLSPHTNYRFRLFSFNGVSDISGRESKYIEVMLQTSEGDPSAVGHVRVIERTSSEVLLSWEPPNTPNGVILEYEIQYNSNGINSPRISRSNKTKNQSFRLKYLPPSTSFVVQVRARNAAGYGLFSSPLVVRTTEEVYSNSFDVEIPILVEINPQTDPHTNIDVTGYKLNTLPRESSDEMHLVIGIGISCALLIVVLVALFIVCGFRKRKGKSQEHDIEVYPFFSNAADLLNNANYTMSQRTYIDPSTYGDPVKAVLEFAREIDNFNIKKEDLMGSGKFGDVYKGLLRPTTPICDDTNTIMTSSSYQPSGLVTVAIKTLKVGYSEKQKEDFLSEASIMGQFNHPNVIRLEGVVTRTTPLMIVTEYMENGSLDTFLEDKHFKDVEVDILQLVSMLRDIADGMKYLAEMGYVHRDLAARNILVDDRLVCKVSDFGLNRVLENIEEEETAIYTTRGSLIPVRWTAPEVIAERQLTTYSNVWSFGIVAWEALTQGERPYWEMPSSDVVLCVECGYRLPPPAFCPRVLHNLMLNCWNVDRTRRPTFGQIVSQLESMLVTPERLQDTINNTPISDQAECIPESLDLSSLGQWLEDMNMTHYKDIMLRYGCVTAEQIIKLTASQLDEMGIMEPTMQHILLNGADMLHQKLEEVQNRGVAV